MTQGRDPFADKRKTSNGFLPKQAQDQRTASVKRQNKRKYRSMDKARAEKEKLENLEDKVEKAKEIIEMAKQAPTPAQQRRLLFAKFEDHDFDPIEEMIKYAKNKKHSMKDRLPIIKQLSELGYAKPKSIDVVADVKSSQQIVVMDFSKTTQAQLKQATPVLPDQLPEVPDGAYDEFLSPEEIDKRRKEAILDAEEAGNE